MSDIKESCILSFDRYTIYSNVSNSNGRKARLVFSIREGMPRITVFTNDAADTDPKQMISVPVDPVALISLFDFISKAAISKEESRTQIECFIPVRGEDGKMIDKSMIGYIVAGKDSSGIVFISVISEGRPKIKFGFNSGNLTVFKKMDGSVMSESEASSMVALSTMKCLSHIYMIQFEKAIVDWSNRPKTEQTKGAYTPKASSAPKEEATFTDLPY
jgi:hypothetical protein